MKFKPKQEKQNKQLHILDIGSIMSYENKKFVLLVNKANFFLPFSDPHHHSAHASGNKHCCCQHISTKGYFVTKNKLPPERDSLPFILLGYV